MRYTLAALAFALAFTACRAANPLDATPIQGPQSAGTPFSTNPFTQAYLTPDGGVQPVSAANPLPVNASVTASVADGLRVQGMDGGMPLPVQGTVTANAGTGTLLVNPAPQTGCACTEQCVTNSAGGTTITVPANSVTMWLSNLGPNPASCTYSGTTPVALTTGDTLSGWAAGATDPIDRTAVLPIKASTITLKCIAATAAQVSGHCLQLCACQ